MDFTSQLKELRRKRHLTQDKIAQALGVSRQAVAKWESGSCQPDMQNLTALAHLLDTTIDELVLGPSNKSSEEAPHLKSMDEFIINQGLRRALAKENPEEEIKYFLEFLGRQLQAERIYILEWLAEGYTFSNTYEWCAKGVTPRKGDLQNAPIETISIWLDTLKNNRAIYIYNIDDIRETNRDLYQWLAPQGIKSAVTLPLFGGSCALIGADNPPHNSITRAASFLEIAAHFVESMLRSRDFEQSSQKSIKEAHERIDQQLKFLNALSQDYLYVFLVDLANDSASSLKVNGYATAGTDAKSTELASYSELCQRYVADFVHPNDKNKVLHALSPDHVRTELSDKNEYIDSFRVINHNETHYYQMKYIRISEDASNYLLAFNNVDALMAREAARKITLEKEVSKAHALLRVFRSAYHIDLENGTFTELSCRVPEVHEQIGVGGIGQKAVSTLGKLYDNACEAGQIMDFLNVATVSKRLADKDSIALQSCTPYAGWTEFFLIAGRSDNEGNLLDCYLATRSIAQQKHREEKAASALKESRSRERQARSEANRDALTGLLNRRAYESSVETCRSFDRVGVIFCDANGLKAANDNLGHKEGDKLLKRFAELLRQYFSDDSIYRIGGDEFVILVPKLAEQSFKNRFYALSAAIADEDSIAASGMACGTGADIDSLILHAEDAMYAEKITMKGTRR